MSYQVLTNRRWRPLQDWHSLPVKFQQEFEHVEQEDRCTPRFFSYRGWWYDLNDFVTVSPGHRAQGLEGWMGVQADSFFSATLVRYDSTMEHVQVGRCYC
jgi:hypothetical protein